MPWIVESFLGSIDCRAALWVTSVRLNGTQIDMKLDTGADVTVIPSVIFKILDTDSINVSTTARSLIGVNSSALDMQGFFSAELCSDGITTSQEVYVASNLKQPLLGRPTIVALNLLQLNADIAEVSTTGIHDLASATKAFPKLFQPLGKLMGEPYQI